MTLTNLFGRRLKAARTAAGISQRQVGISAGIEESTAAVRINQYEHGRHMPSLDVAARLAQALDLSLAYFYCPQDDMAGAICLLHRLQHRFQDIHQYLRFLLSADILPEIDIFTGKPASIAAKKIPDA